MNRFVGRDTDLKGLETNLFPDSLRRKVYVIHGLGGIGKTQLAIEFARKHHIKYSAVFWLDASSKDILGRSLVDVARGLPQHELLTETTEELRNPKVDIDIVVRGVDHWLSLSSNQHWLLIFDNVDRDHTLQEKDPQAYDVKEFFPSADHGSILITSRLSNLERHGTGSKLSIVDEEQAMEILENNAKRSIRGE